MIKYIIGLLYVAKGFSTAILGASLFFDYGPSLACLVCFIGLAVMCCGSGIMNLKKVKA